MSNITHQKHSFSCLKHSEFEPLEQSGSIVGEMSPSASMNFVTKKFSRMSTRFRTRRSTISGSSTEGRTSFSNSISSISKSCRLKKPTFKRPTFKRRKSVQRVPSIRDAFDEMCRSHILDYIIVSLVRQSFHNIFQKK